MCRYTNIKRWTLTQHAAFKNNSKEERQYLKHFGRLVDILIAGSHLVFDLHPKFDLHYIAEHIFFINFFFVSEVWVEVVKFM